MRRRENRRGVLLLVVLSLLVLFAMITVTFVMVAGQYRRMSRAAGKVELVGDNPRRQLDSVLAQIVRDTENPLSSMRRHSLLNDLYGDDGVAFQSAAALPVVGIAGDQFIDITTNEADIQAVTVPITSQLHTPGFYNGCVLTVVDGAAAGRSTRIVGWGYVAPSYTIRVMAFDGVSFDELFADPPNRVLINGRPFNGTGFGFNTGANPLTAVTMLNATDGNNVFQAYLNNGRFFPRNAPDPGYTALYRVFGGLAGADEDYDAPDLQNMLLAYVPAAIPGGTPVTPREILPSLHRPDLLNNRLPGFTTGTPEEKARRMRRFMMRPLGPMMFGGISYDQVPISGAVDHPNFTGSNPLFDAVNGPWDVDNDGDAVAESVWVDVGMSVTTAPDGRRYKPLAAILCIDLDGRLNVNAHGNFAQTDAMYNTTTNPILPASANKIANYVWSATGTGVASVALPRGSGYGPAEIALSQLFQSPAAFKDFLAGSNLGIGRTYVGRYGEWMGASIPGGPLPGRTANLPLGTPNPLWPGPDNVLAQLTRFAITPPYNYYTSTVPSIYGSPPDLSGRAVLGIDYAGQPIWSFHRNTGSGAVSDVLGAADDEFPNDPYALNLSRRRVRGSADPATAPDSPFTPGELERLLRRYDLDAGALPDRLQYLLERFGRTAPPLDMARTVTTDSFDLPTPAVLPTRAMRDLLIRQRADTTIPAYAELPVLRGLHLVDLLRAKMIEQWTVPVTVVAIGDINSQIATMLPPEVIAGLPFDLNRPLGNGRDENANGVVDEPLEHLVNQEASPVWNTTLNGGAPVRFDLDNNGNTTSGSDIYARQQYARYLYTMMMVLADTRHMWSTDPVVTGNPANQRELTARRIAQWAINVVDFRDPDSIMTPFEYDARPFNGLPNTPLDGIVGLPSTDDGHVDRRVVWGVEYPELLLTETLAFHDKRLKDLSNPDQINTPMTTDPDMDQERMPEGSVFFELYCPHNGSNSVQARASGDLYDNTGAQPRLDLGRMAALGTGANPVWRIAITGRSLDPANDVTTRVGGNRDAPNFDPMPGASLTDASIGSLQHTSLFDPANPPGALFVERYVWFSPQAPAGANPDQGRIYYNAAGSNTLLLPGQFAVVGPRPLTYVGRNIAATVASQQILLDTAAGTTTYTNTAGIPTTYPALPIICTSAFPPATLPVWPRTVGVSVSEPLFSTPNYYPYPQDPGTIPAGNTVIDTYNPVLDQPLDYNNGRPLIADAVAATGMYGVPTSGYKTALLQRLANPLQAYDPVRNPYITVDWQPINLNVFNGEVLPPSPLPDPSDPWNAPSPAPLPGFGSRERGTVAMQSNLWNSTPQQSTNVAIPKGPTAVFDYNFNQSLGYLNRSMGTKWATPPTSIPPVPGDNFGYYNAPTPAPTTNPFSWITWNNRPYANKMELMMVPALSAEEMLRNHRTALTTDDPYVLSSGGVAGFKIPFSHLFNFFQSADGVAPTASYLYRILDFVDVPSRFVGTETFLPPQPWFTAPLVGALTEQQLASFYHPPFSRVSNYRDPGRVNINTIAGPPGATLAPNATNPVWDAIRNGSLGPTWRELVASRRGDTALGDNVTRQDVTNTKPSLFANPFRTAGGAAFGLPVTGATLQPEVNVTLMRPHPATTTRPLLQPDPAVLALPVNAALRGYTDPDRHPYFRYQNFIRLSNSLTTRSNVYAIWITVGYFEVTPWDPDGDTITNYDFAHPDGWQLGQEMGSDTGEITRHRAFYIYDRTIPVGFEPGRDHNIEDGLLLKRFIE